MVSGVVKSGGAAVGRGMTEPACGMRASGNARAQDVRLKAVPALTPLNRDDTRRDDKRLKGGGAEHTRITTISGCTLR